MTDLHGNEPIVFDYDAAGQLVSAARGAASAIRDEKGARSRAVAAAMEQFRGYYSQLFAANARTADGDGDQLIAALDGLATIAQNLIAAAHSEDSRRATARKWYEDHEHRSTLDKIGDALFGEDSPPEGPKPPPPAALPTIPQPQPRHIGGQGSSGGTSSAIPDHLTSFASTSAAVNSRIDPHQSRVASLVHTFNANTRWGQIDAGALLAAFLAWNKANENDVSWARTLAAAFTAAGGSGALVTLSNSSLGAALKAAGVNASRHDLAITMPQTKGFSVTTGYSLDPVNTATGNFIESETDLAFGGAAALALTRMYNSFTLEEGAFGHGWSSLAEAGLAIDDEKASLTLADGRVVVFPRLGDGWDQPVSDALWLSTLEDGSHRITGNDGSWWTCSPAGRMTAFGTGPGTTVTLTHDHQGHLVELSHGRGRAITLTWTGERVSAAATSDGRVASYTYDDEGHLLSVSAPGADRTYRWDTDAHLVTAVIDADGVVEAENTYDEQRRVATQLTPHGRHVRFSYLPGRVTVIDDPDGSNANTWIADPWGRLVGVIDSDDHRQSMSYDAHGNLVVLTERDGSTTIHEYDDRSRRTRTVTPSGADLQFAYDELDRVTTVVTEAGAVTTYTYDGDERNPATITDPEGGITALTWDRGLMRSITGPTGITVTFHHDEHGNLVASTDADGNTARLEHDAAGRVAAAITPLGHRTGYAYDAAGNLAERTDPDGAVWRYEYTAAGRLTATVDPLGNRTVIEHAADGETRLIIDPLGRETRFQHDAFGNLSSIVLPDGQRWSYGHDSLSRPTTVAAPDGATWTTSYDVNGAPVSITDPSGVRASVVSGRSRLEVHLDGSAGALEMDQLGRPTHTTDVDGGETVVVFDRCGRVVESIDADGGLTRFEYSAAGQLVATTTPGGARTTYEWDSCGRTAAMTDPAGARTTYAYDADRRLVRVTLPTGEVAETDYDACGRVVSRRVPGVGRSHITYDLAGRVVEVRDPVNGRRRFEHDASGQIVAAIDGNGGTTRYEYDALGRAVAITNALGAVTRRRFDSRGRCVAETDPLGRTTRAGYDGAGRQLWQEGPDGRRTAWTYDAAGRLLLLSVDGVVQRRLQRDLRSRTLTIVDTSDPSRECLHELRWNPRQQLIARSRDGRRMAWTYDADGRRTSMTTPDGNTTSYSYDACGHLVGVEHPLFGRATFTRDAAGRLTRAHGGDVAQTWSYTDGYVASHVVTTPAGVAETVIERDAEGRAATLTRDGISTTFGYDEAAQLIAALFGGGGNTWRYDEAGRLVTESADGTVTEHTYDAAGQLLSSTSGARVVAYGYDSAGRRTTKTVDDQTTTYSWDALGWLQSISGSGRTIRMHVDALGEPASIDGSEIFVDSASGVRPVVQAGTTAVLAADGITGIGASWTATGWRSARSTSAHDPWTLSPQRGTFPGLPSTVSIGAGGELFVDGLEWMNARVYDPASRGFLSTDPLDPVAGTGWSGNPYSYAGNDPLHLLDPLGLRPATDADLKAWTAAHAGVVGDVVNWAKNNWEYVAAGAMIVGGALLMATPLGSTVGMALISGGIDAGLQKLTTGHVNWTQVAVSAVVGGITGGAAGAWAESMSAGGTVALRTTMLANGVMGAGGSEATYLVNGLLPGGKGITLRGALGAGAGGFIGGAAGGAAGPVGGTIAKQLGRTATSPVASIASHVISSTGAVAGGAVNGAVADGKIDPTSLAIDAVAGNVAEKVHEGVGSFSEKHFEAPLEVQGHATLKQLSYFGPKSMGAAMNPHTANGAAGVRSALTGSVIDLAKDRASEPVKHMLGVGD